MPASTTEEDRQNLSKKIKQIGLKLGFQQVGITDTDLSVYEKKLNTWIKQGWHGDMHYMEKHGEKRTKPSLLVGGTVRIISVRMDYLPVYKTLPPGVNDDSKASIACYALGRDYHKLMRKRLSAFAKAIFEIVGKFQYRVFVDSAPVLEKPIAEKSGLGWIGKHTNLINAKAGSWFFLGEIYTDLPLISDQSTTKSHCGSCQACIAICPTQAIIAPYQLDARRCISYLTIELKHAIPMHLRPLIGNRIYGCDDCQLICPWNKFAKITKEKDFYARNHLSNPDLLTLFSWTLEEFLKFTEGSAIRRIGYICWLRNIAVALGNSKQSHLAKHEKIIFALQQKLHHPSAMVREHVAWAIEQQMKRID